MNGRDNAAVRAFFDARAAKWDETCPHDPAKLQIIARLCCLVPGAAVLDVACGTGVMFGPLLAHGAESITGIDLSPNMVAEARKKWSGEPRVRLLTGDALDLGMPGFDLAVIYSAYPHFPDREALARAMARCLAPHGRFLVAHSESRAAINGRHHSPPVQAVSTTLRPAAQEAPVWEPFFALATLIDTPELYVLSGTLR